MNQKLIIIEGMDNTGKTTLINRLTNVLSHLGYTFKVIKADNPLKGEDLSKIDAQTIERHTDEYYKKFLNTIKKEFGKCIYNFIILDRSWVSEYVYGPEYRSMSKLHIVESNIVHEQYILDLFTPENVYMFILTADIDMLKKNEDGLSLSNNNTDQMYNELTAFSQIPQLTLIDKCYYYNVTSPENTYIDILPQIYKTII